jgi:hypothetical protein
VVRGLLLENWEVRRDLVLCPAGSTEKAKGLESLRFPSRFQAFLLARSTGLEPVDEGYPNPATAHAFRAVVSESGHFESTGLSPAVSHVS